MTGAEAAAPADVRRRSPRERLAGFARGVPRRELAFLVALVLIGLAIRVAFVLITSGHVLAGDEIEYDTEGRFISEGKWFWATTPLGYPHESIWKAPGYPLVVGALYTLLGDDPDRAIAAQTLLGPVTIVLTWLLGRRLFGPVVALGAAAVVAVHPFAWQFETRLYAESIVTPFTVLVLYFVLDRHVTWRRAAGVGVLMALMLLTRPSAMYLIPGIAVAWMIARGWRHGLLLSGLTVAVTVLLVVPWTIRNHAVSGDWVPISAQDQALYGVFNPDAANDPVHPYAWRPLNSRDRDLIANRRELTEAELRRRLRSRAFEFIRENPDSLIKAFYWNGLSRLWDVRRPARILDEVKSTGRSRRTTAIGIAFHYVLLPLAVLGLWFARRRRPVVLPVLAIAASATLIFTAEAATRYRAPLEPLIAIFAAYGAWQIVERLRARRSA